MMGEVKPFPVTCQICKREIPDQSIYYTHPKYGYVCEYCPQFEDGPVKLEPKEPK